MLELLTISFALVFGLLMQQIRIPPLVGFLLAGFALSAWGPDLGMPEFTGPVLDHIAHVGILLLLFTVGLKLKLRQLIQRHVVGTSLIHFTVTTAVFTGALVLLAGLAGREAVLLAIALSFSSTVLAAKMLDAKRELRAFHGRSAIGILIIQDLIAIATLALFSEHKPSPWALLLLALPLLRPLLYWLLETAGREELLVLVGMLMAVVIGGLGFETVGLSGELGALLMGVLLGEHGRSKALADALWSLKEVFLVGFFLQIGLAGLPSSSELLFAGALALVLPLKALLFFALLIAFHLRVRNALVCSLSLTCYSEFGLIVAAVLLEEWVVPLAVAVALSFIVSAPLNRNSNLIVERLEHRLKRFERSWEHPDEQPIALDNADVLILGMGRVGTATYDYIRDRGLRPIGIDSDPSRISHHTGQGRKVAYADADDPFFWHNLDLSDVRAVVLALAGQESKETAVRQLRQSGYHGLIVGHAMHQEEADRVTAQGADDTYLTMTEAGFGLGEHLCSALQPATPTEKA
ncbi:sodium:proton exchanger [Spiribacter halobius]|uniref:Sodium:proton exchanger n=2 Tax=Sediminicurvatus halobius TaxID=2182432 RepID=A0A2U2MY15_9GAMM|nr:sodium:proton exchanger [Spiribacter halobius]